MKPNNKHHANSMFPAELLASIQFVLVILCFAAFMAISSNNAKADNVDDTRDCFRLALLKL